MTRSEKLSDIKGDLRSLASILVCVRNHQDQADEVYNDWKGLVAKELLKLSEQQQKEKERRKTLKLRSDLAKMRSIASQARAQLEENDDEVVVVCLPPTQAKSAHANLWLCRLLELHQCLRERRFSTVLQ